MPRKHSIDIPIILITSSRREKEDRYYLDGASLVLEEPVSSARFEKTLQHYAGKGCLEQLMTKWTGLLNDNAKID